MLVWACVFNSSWRKESVDVTFHSELGTELQTERVVVELGNGLEDHIHENEHLRMPGAGRVLAAIQLRIEGSLGG